MKDTVVVLVVAILVPMQFISTSSESTPHCEVVKPVTVSEAVTTYYEEPQTTLYPQDCTWWWGCSERSQMKYVKKSRMTYRISQTLRNVSVCCHGYTGTPPTCYDIDECQAINGGCDHHCHNTEGSYYCSCDDGYSLDEDGHNCLETRSFIAHKRSLTNSINENERNFYFAIPNHPVDTLIISVQITAEAPVTYQMDKYSGMVSGSVSANSTTVVSLSYTDVVQSGSFTYRDRGVHLNTSGPVSVLATIHRPGGGSSGEFPVYPLEPLDLDEYVYHAVSTGSLYYSERGFILLVGINTTTTITVVPTVDVTMPSDVQDSSSSMITVSAGNPKTFTLNSDQTLIIKTTTYTSDLSGTKITASNQLSVITGHECGSIPWNVVACEHIIEHVPPTASWGKQFMVSPYQGRSGQFYQIIASKSSTNIKHNCGNGISEVSMTSAGDFELIETISNTYCYIEADKPILVTQMAPSSSYDSIIVGDSAISVIPPMGKFVTKTPFYVPNNNDGINVFQFNIISTSNTATFSLSGTTVSTTWTAITDTNGYTVGYGSQAISSTVGSTYILTNSDDSLFYILVYGFASDRAFSYTPVFSLTCDEGYDYGINGTTCEDIDECSTGTHNCQISSEQCVNIVGSFICAPICNDGFQLNTINDECIDIDECSTNENYCEHNCTNTDGSYDCSCYDGYKKYSEYYCQDIDECESDNGGCGQSCTNIPGSFKCSCHEGYNLETNGSCTDINECHTNNTGGCEHNCQNTDGSYYCTCNDGYKLHSDGTSCIDINECDNHNGGCDHNCINTNGSYYCTCNDGYSLKVDNKQCEAVCPDACDSHCSECTSPNVCVCDPGWTGNTCCTDIDECSISNGGCDHDCHNVNGSFACSCQDGYSLNSDGFNCDDINECTEGTDECSDGCVNTVGFYKCSCLKGYELDSDGVTCVDTYECANNNGGCDSVNGDCVNTVGSYNCTCNEGYRLLNDKHSCGDINECSEGTGDCSNTCINNIGSYTCDCPVGYELDTNNVDCVDTNECSNQNGGCDDHCINTNGSYYCECLDGHSLDSDNHGCSDINECTEGTDDCDQLCYNSHSSYHCGCNLGYTLDDDATSCNDINECTEHISGCNQVCNNTEGSYTCSCYTGYTIDSDGKICYDNNECLIDNGGCNHTCENTPGSFLCRCNTGYELDSDDKGCSDIDECTLGTDYCEHNCHNTIGSYTCSCNTGYQLDSSGYYCIDVNECLINNGGCDDQCVNTAGSYYCECDDNGYSLGADEHSCVDINECDNHNGGCDHNCNNTNGSYYCTCNEGYGLDIDDKGCSPICTDAMNHCTKCVLPGICLCLDGWTGDDCTMDINECNTLNGECEQNCENTPGSFLCHCNEGYSKEGPSCKDIDECTDGTHDCSQVCNNTEGSYTCSCNDRYKLGVDDKTCLIQCTPDFYSANGITDCIECPSGTYGVIDHAGLTRCIPCTSNDKLNKTFIRCYDVEQSSGTSRITDSEESKQSMLYAFIVSTAVLAAILILLVIAILIGLQRKKGRARFNHDVDRDHNEGVGGEVNVMALELTECREDPINPENVYETVQ